MADRLVGQLGFADGLVSGGGESMLDKIAATVDWEPIAAWVGSRGGSGPGSPSYPGLVLLRCLLLGVWHDLSDPALENPVGDRLAFRRFGGLSLHGPGAEYRPLWGFRGGVAEDGLEERVFAEIVRQLDVKGLIVKRGTLIDASLVPAAARPARKAKNPQAAVPAKPGHDVEARWGRKGHKSVFGYKIHIGADQDHTTIRRVELTDAS